MLVACWSVKGGCGTTVVAAALALLLAESGRDPVVLVDLGGDASAVLGVADRRGDAGLEPPWWDEPSSGSSPTAGRVRSITPGLDLVSLGLPDPPSAARPGATERLITALGEWEIAVVDCGPAGPRGPALTLAAEATISLLVTRPCFLALRRAAEAPIRPSAVVVVEEPGRALGSPDVEAVVGAPVRATVPWDAAIARVVDAGLLASRVPAPLSRALRSAA